MQHEGPDLAGLRQFQAAAEPVSAAENSRGASQPGLMTLRYALAAGPFL